MYLRYSKDMTEIPDICLIYEKYITEICLRYALYLLKVYPYPWYTWDIWEYDMIWYVTFSNFHIRLAQYKLDNKGKLLGN